MAVVSQVSCSARDRPGDHAQLSRETTEAFVGGEQRLSEDVPPSGPRERGSSRLLVLPAVVLMQGCLGGVYAWSRLAPWLEHDFGYSAGQTQVVFGLTITVFTVVMVYAGRLIKRIGPRSVGLLGGILFAAGHLTASLPSGQYLGLLAGYALLGGAGIGCGYVAALAAAVQWFPRQRGLVTGMAVAGFGAGAIVLSSLIAWLMQFELSVLDVLRTVGLGYGTVLCLSALLLFRPPPSGVMPPIAWQGLLRAPGLRVLAWGMFCGTFAGLLVIGNLKTIGESGGVSPSAAVLAISLFAIGNAAGRIGWGWVADRTGYGVVPLSLLFSVLALVIILLSRMIPVIFPLAALLMGLGFGACFVLYAAQVATRYGVEALPAIYPLVFLAYGLAGVTGPPLGGLLFDLTGSYVWPMLAAAAVLLAGALLTWRGRADFTPED